MVNLEDCQKIYPELHILFKVLCPLCTCTIGFGDEGREWVDRDEDKLPGTCK